MQDIGKLLKATMNEKQCNATCAFIVVSISDAREAQKSNDSAKKNKKA